MPRARLGAARLLDQDVVVKEARRPRAHQLGAELAEGRVADHGARTRRSAPSCRSPRRRSARRRVPAPAARARSGCGRSRAAAPRPARGRAAPRIGTAPSRWKSSITSVSSGVTPAPRSRPRPRPAARRRRAAPSTAASSGASQRSGPAPGISSRTAFTAAPVPRAGSSGARSSSGAGRAGELDARIRRRLPTARRSFRAAPQPIETWSSCIALVGSESTDAGAARRRFSATIAACVYWADHQPRVDARVVGEEGRQAVRARGVEQPIGAPLADRAHLGGGDREEIAGEADRRAVEVAARLDPAVGQHHRVVDRGCELGARRSGRRALRCRGRLRGPAACSGSSRSPGPAGRRCGGWRRSPSPRAAPRRLAALAA